MFDENLKKEYVNTCKFKYKSNHDTNKFILLLRKSVYPYKYMGDCEKFYEILLSIKEYSYSHLNMEYITDAYYTKAKRVCKDFDLKYWGKYYDLYF